MFRFIYIILLLLFCLPIGAVETMIVGDVVDSETGLPIPNVSVYYQFSKIGTTTNSNGFFSLHTTQDKTLTLIFSAVGYKTHRMPVTAGTTLGLQIRMIPRTAGLDEIVVTPGANPALHLISQVRAHRQDNDRSLQEDYECKWQTQDGLYLSDLQARHLRRRLWKNLRSGMVQVDDSSFLLPIASADGELRLQSRHISRHMLTKTSLIPEDIDWQNLVEQMPAHCNFYQSSIPMFGQTILSPLAPSANRLYSFYLIDSLRTTDSKHYLIDFRPKHPHYALLAGQMEIDSADYSLCRVTASTPRETNIGMLRELHVTTYYDRYHNLVQEQQQAVLDIAIPADSSHIFPSLLIDRRTIFTSTTAVDTQTFIPSNTTIPTVDTTLLSLPLIRVANWIGTTLATGYMPTGSCIDIGNVVELLQFNPVEIVHVGLPLRTNEQLWRHVSLEAYAAYGWRDRAWKGKGQITIDLPTERRHMIGLRYWDHYQHTETSSFTAFTRENVMGSGDQGWITTMFRSPWDTKPSQWSGLRRQSMKLWSENDWWQGADSRGHELRIETNLGIEIGRQYMCGDGWGYADHDPYYRFSLVHGYLRLGWDERISDRYMQRRHFYHDMPSLQIGAEMGTYQLPSMPYYAAYGRLDISLRQYVSLGLGGRLGYRVQAGIILGDVPYPVLQVFGGRAGVLYQEDRFSLLQSMESLADRYIALHLDWDGQGILFNLIPGIRRLGLHELLETKMAYGTLSDRHTHVAPLPIHMHSLQDCPYVEVGVGIGHLLRFVDLYSMWRVTRRNDPDATLWSMQFRLSL